MKGSFAAARLEEVPDWAAGPDGAAIQVALGDDQDAAIRGLEDAAKFPSPFLCPDDALDLVGQTFGLPRYPGEVNGTAPLGTVPGTGYRGRLCVAWETWQWAGTPTGVLGQLAVYAPGAEFTILTDTNGAWSLDANGNLVHQFAGAHVTTYPNIWYSRFDLAIGPAFGQLAVQRSIIAPLVATTVAPFTVPAVGASVSVTVDSSPWTGGEAIYIGQAGYYEVANGSGHSYFLKNLGSAAAAEPEVGLVAGTLGGGVNAAPGTVIATGQLVVAAAGTAGSGPNISSALIIGQGLIGISLAIPSQRQTLKAIPLRWKAPHGYFGRLVLVWDAAGFGGTPGYDFNFTYVGRMIGLSMWIGITPIGGYDRT